MSADIIYLKEGEVYFHAAFTDSSLSIPSIKTLVYRGIDNEHGHLFEEMEGESSGYLCYPDKISPCILNHKALSEWLLEKHSPQTTLKEYVYKSI